MMMERKENWRLIVGERVLGFVPGALVALRARAPSAMPFALGFILSSANFISAYKLKER